MFMCQIYQNFFFFSILLSKLIFILFYLEAGSFRVFLIKIYQNLPRCSWVILNNPYLIHINYNDDFISVDFSFWLNFIIPILIF